MDFCCGTFFRGGEDVPNVALGLTRDLPTSAPAILIEKTEQEARLRL
jgi:hypothetical protein